MNEGIRSAIESATTYVTEHPDEARYTDSVASATLIDGLQVKVEGPAGEALITDMPAAVGGGAQGPSPGWLFRASLASCVATLIAMRAASLGVELRRLQVIVDSESDDRGILGIDDAVPAGPLSIKVIVRIDGADQDQLEAIAEWGHRHCPVCDAASRMVPMTLEVEAG
jgi:uncharacterized OsmC-like protein